MIRKLRAKFIITNMLLISIVLIAAFVFVYFSTAKNLENESIAAMKDISTQVGNDKRFDIFGTKDEKENEEYSYLKTFTIDTNEANMTYQIDGNVYDAEDMTDEQNDYLNTLIETVYSSTKDEGIIEEYNLRYYSVETAIGNRIVFLDKDYEDNNLQRLLITFSIVSICALAAFLIISIIISKIAVAPVEKSLKQQAQLVADASHELKTPITVISANADILLANKDSTIKEQSKWVEYIKTESARMTQLVNNMLFLAKTDANKMVETQNLIHLSDTITSCILPFESICFEKQKTLEMAINPNIYIKGNENSIKQLIIILVDNAFKYSNDNGIIKVSVYEDQEKAILSVWNTGTPIPTEQLSHIFERFYRVDKSRSRTEGGYGLGLSIASSIVESHNAKIEVQSTEEKGTLFTCMFKKQKFDK